MKILIDVSVVALNFPNSLQIALRYRFPGRCSDSFFITRLWRKNCRVGVSKPTSKLGVSLQQRVSTSKTDEPCYEAHQEAEAMGHPEQGPGGHCST